jgi:2-polyprenyl-6-hydroxyphenyl methylase/3-demethylubiquinone-9 3-methyltransferase
MKSVRGPLGTGISLSQDNICFDTPPIGHAETNTWQSLSMNISNRNIDPGEIAHFDDHAVDWWDPKGPLKALHDINPIRLQYIENRIGIAGKSFLDVGCGGGILSESLARSGGYVTGIDMTDSALNAAREHNKKTSETVTYRRITVEAFLEETPNQFDNITCMELLEHVPRPSSVLKACAQLLKPGGNMFVATVNRTWTAYLLVILAAEHLLSIVRKGTHTYENFVRPDEIDDWATDAGLRTMDLSGFLYNPFTGGTRLTAFTKMNYLMHLRKI